MARGTTLQHPAFCTTASAQSAVDVLNPGTSLEVVRQEGSFFFVRLDDGREGFVDAQLVVPEVPAAPNLTSNATSNAAAMSNAAATTAMQTGHTIENPNFHVAPIRESAVMEVLHAGIAVQIMGREGDYWRCILPDGRQGYINVVLVVVDGSTRLGNSAPMTNASTSTSNATRGNATGNGGLPFTNASDVDGWFRAQTGSDFVSWFNARHAGTGSWTQSRIQGDHAAEGFERLWDRLAFVFDRPSVSLEQFLTLTSVIIGETMGRYWPISELVGMTGHPGIAYAFDRIPGLKSSYNVSPNRSAGSLFNDADFLQAFAQLPMIDSVRNSSDPRWNGTAYPSEFPSDVGAGTGIIRECDFYKFRGRGFIQTTWRSAYMDLIAYVQNSDDANPVVAKYRNAWAGLAPDLVATIPTNAEWDELFQQSECAVACAGVRIHNKNSGDYLNVASDRDTFRGQGAGSAWMCGIRVNGATAYADTLRARVLQLRDSLP